MVGSSYAIAAVITLTFGMLPRDSSNPFTLSLSPVSFTIQTPFPKQHVSQLESSSALSASFRLGTAAARIVLRPQLLLIPGPALGAGAGAAASASVPRAPAVRGLAPPAASFAALAALT